MKRLRREKLHISIDPSIKREIEMFSKKYNVKISRITEELYKFFIKLDKETEL